MCIVCLYMYRINVMYCRMYKCTCISVYYYYVCRLHACLYNKYLKLNLFPIIHDQVCLYSINKMFKDWVGDIEMCGVFLLACIICTSVVQ